MWVVVWVKSSVLVTGWLTTNSWPGTMWFASTRPLSLTIWSTVVLFSLAISATVSPGTTVWVVVSSVVLST